MKVPCTLALDPDTIAALDRLAVIEGRTRSGLARRVLAAALDTDFPDPAPALAPDAALRCAAPASSAVPAGGGPSPVRG